MSIDIPESHPRAQSLHRREALIEGCLNHVVAYAGLMAHGRGEAFDYLIGEATPECALEAIKTAAAKLLIAERPVISVNGNVAILCPEELVALSEVTGAKLEINLFYRTRERELAIKDVMEKAGAKEIFGLDADRLVTIPELQSRRRIVDREGIYAADVVVVPLEDGDRTEALVKLGKYVITVDLNPLSRTARMSDLCIVDEVARAFKLVIQYCREFKNRDRAELLQMVESFSNRENLSGSLRFISKRLESLAQEGI